jgi:hypothetical protein
MMRLPVTPTAAIGDDSNPVAARCAPRSPARRSARLAVAALLAAGVLAPPAGAQPTQSQAYFTEKLLDDPKTSRNVADLIRGEGFVDRSVTFRDLTGDDKPEALVRVQSGGAAGTVAVYVFSTDTGGDDRELSTVFRSQRLYRAATEITGGVLTYDTARYAIGDELCCPLQLQRTTLRWDDGRHRFRIGGATEIPGPRPAAAG